MDRVPCVISKKTYSWLQFRLKKPTDVVVKNFFTGKGWLVSSPQKEEGMAAAVCHSLPPPPPPPPSRYLLRGIGYFVQGKKKRGKRGNKGKEVKWQKQIRSERGREKKRKHYCASITHCIHFLTSQGDKAKSRGPRGAPLFSSTPNPIIPPPAFNLMEPPFPYLRPFCYISKL